MDKPFILILEGSVGSGKSTLSKLIRENMPYTMLLDLSAIKDKSEETGKDKMHKYHSKILQMFEDTIGCDMSYVCSRSFLSELCYTELGFKEYSFKENANELMSTVEYLTKHYNIFFVLLTVDEGQLENRLRRDKFEYVKHNVKNAIIQQNMYKNIFRHYANLNTDIKFFEVENGDLNATVNTIKNIIEGYLG